jgi:hypothetical protein
MTGQNRVGKVASFADSSRGREAFVACDRAARLGAHQANSFTAAMLAASSSTVGCRPRSNTAWGAARVLLCDLSRGLFGKFTRTRLPSVALVDGRNTPTPPTSVHCVLTQTEIVSIERARSQYQAKFREDEQCSS